MTDRRGDWMQTFTGRQFWPLDPRPDEVEILDIAHALANLCRYGGHCRRFYSVAEHSVLLTRAVAPEYRLLALLHDASEAYLVDLPRPVKLSMPEYKAIEQVVMVAICERFGLALPGLDANRALGRFDRRILLDEQAQNMATPPVAWSATEGLDPLGVTLRFWKPDEAEFWFLREFDVLTEGRFSATPAPLPRGCSLKAGAAHG